MAEALFRQMVRKAGQEKDFRVVSAGLSAPRGQGPTPLAVDALDQEGLDLSGHRTRPVTEELVNHADVIVAMTRGHLDTLMMLFPEAADRAYVLREFEPGNDGYDLDLPDPIGLPRAVYLRCRDVIKSALPGVLQFAQHSPAHQPITATAADPKTTSEAGTRRATPFPSQNDRPKIPRQRGPRHLRRHPGGGAPAGREHRTHRLGELHLPRRARGPGLGADQQVRRGLPRQTLVRRLRARGRRGTRWPSSAPSACSGPSTPTSSRIPARRRTWRSISRPSSPATGS